MPPWPTSWMLWRMSAKPSLQKGRIELHKPTKRKLKRDMQFFSMSSKTLACSSQTSRKECQSHAASVQIMTALCCAGVGPALLSN
eukprot:136242-Amphidinium_carterae.1